MTDGIIKGTGNSRYLKSSLDGIASWEDFKAALQNGTLPIDLNGINTEGWTTVGTPLNKSTLLKADTETLLGLPENSTVDDAFVRIKTSALKCESGSYTGTGVAGSNVPCSLTFDFMPILVFISRNEVLAGGNSNDSYKCCGAIFMYPNVAGMWYGIGYSANHYANNGFSLTWGDKTVSWITQVYPTSNPKGGTLLNESGVVYNYTAIG